MQTKLEVMGLSPELSCSSRLRELCILEGRFVTRLRGSDPLLLDVSGSLLALDAATARLIQVRHAGCD
jgi:Fe2+ transport system protein FeoA